MWTAAPGRDGQVSGSRSGAPSGLTMGWFWGPLSPSFNPENVPLSVVKCSYEAMIAQISMIFSTNQPGVVFFQRYWHTTPLEPGYLFAVELKGPRPAPGSNGEPEERLR